MRPKPASLTVLKEWDFFWSYVSTPIRVSTLGFSRAWPAPYGYQILKYLKGLKLIQPHLSQVSRGWVPDPERPYPLPVKGFKESSQRRRADD